MDARIFTRRSILAAVLACLALLGGLAKSSAGSQLCYLGAPRIRAEFGLSDVHFAIGDFDGDQKPDLATVQADAYAQRATRYSIRLQLSFGAKSAVGLTAPFGGLLLSAKDVNGDRNLDLVVTAAIDAHLVAVLVNDGHGNFSLAADGSFPELRGDRSCHFGAPAAPSSPQIPLLESRCPSGEAGDAAGKVDTRFPSESFLTTEQQIPTRWNAGAALGRAPPTCCSLR